MRIERAQHAEDRRLEDIVVVQLAAIDVLMLDHFECFVEIALDCGSSRTDLSCRPPAGQTITRFSAAGSTARGRLSLLRQHKIRSHQTGDHYKKNYLRCNSFHDKPLRCSKTGGLNITDAA